MLTAGRNQVGLTEQQIEYCLETWAVLCGGLPIELDTSEAGNSSRTRFSEERNKVFLGADALSGEGVDAVSRMSALACLGHELAHVERFRLGCRRPLQLPDALLDEAENELARLVHFGLAHEGPGGSRRGCARPTDSVASATQPREADR